MGGRGNDTLVSTPQDDKMVGKRGNDTFVFSANNGPHHRL
jgi:Ca2+-binding RTX toxin-like protein